MTISAFPSVSLLISGHLSCCVWRDLAFTLFFYFFSSCSVPDESSSSGGRQFSSPEHGPPAGSDTDSSVEEESDFDTMPEIESDKNVIRTKVWLAHGQDQHLSLSVGFNFPLSSAGFHLIEMNVLLSVLSESKKFSWCAEHTAEVNDLMWKIRIC